MLLLRKIALVEHVKLGNKWEHHIMTIIRPLEVLHMDLFGPITYISIDGNKYGIIIIIINYSRFTWVFFLQDKSKT
jgi:hypothetical protein